VCGGEKKISFPSRGISLTTGGKKSREWKEVQMVHEIQLKRKRKTKHWKRMTRPNSGQKNFKSM